MKKVVEYQIVSMTTRLNLESQINNLIKYGWVPQGGLATFGPQSYVQAMVKYEV